LNTINWQDVSTVELTDYPDLAEERGVKAILPSRLDLQAQLNRALIDVIEQARIMGTPSEQVLADFEALNVGVHAESFGMVKEAQALYGFSPKKTLQVFYGMLNLYIDDVLYQKLWEGEF